MSSDNGSFGMIGKAIRAMGKSRLALGAKAVKEEMSEAARDNAPAAGESYYSKRDKKIGDSIRARREKRKGKS